MKELITRAQADVLMNTLLGMGLFIGAGAAMLAKKRGDAVIAAALLWGGPLALAGVMWRVYNAITDRMGLDSVANLFVNAVLFIVVGAACGFGWVFFAGRKREAE